MKFLIILTFLLSSLGFAKSRSLKNSVTAFSALNKPGPQCKFDDDEDDTPFESIFSCKPFKIKANGCTTKEYLGGEGETTYKRTNIIEMDCDVCGMKVHTIGKINSGARYDDDETTEIVFDRESMDYTFSHMTTETDFSTIQQACATLLINSPKGYNVSLEDLQEHMTSFDGLFQQDQSYNLPPFKTNPPSVKALSGNGKICGEGDEDKAEVTAYIESLKPILNTGPSKPYKSITYIDGPLKDFGLPQLINVWAYETSDHEDNKTEVEKAYGIKLGAQDVKAKIHHLVFDQKKPDIDFRTYLEGEINRPSKIYRPRIIDPKCEADKVEHLNISVKSADGTLLEPERYKIICTKKDNYKTLKLIRL